jgi:hypothetical protein
MGAPREDSKPQRALRRCQETSRLEDQLWILVFEELWPVATRSTRREAMGEWDVQRDGEFEQQRQHARRA